MPKFVSESRLNKSIFCAPWSGYKVADKLTDTATWLGGFIVLSARYCSTYICISLCGKLCRHGFLDQTGALLKHD